MRHGWVALAVILLCSGPAFGHGGHDTRLKVFQNEQTIRIQTSISSGLLMEFDENQDGRLSAGEFSRQFVGINNWVSARFGVRDSAGEFLMPVLSDLPVEHFSSYRESDPIHLIKVIRQYDAPAGLSNFHLHFELFSNTEQEKEYVIWSNGVFSNGELRREETVIPLN